MTPIALKAQRVTLYVLSQILGTVHRIQATHWEVVTGPWAQHETAVRTAWIPKGKRACQSRYSGTRHFVLVLDGWGHPEPGDGYREDANGGRSCRAFDPRTVLEFNTLIGAYLAKGTAIVLADHRAPREEVAA